VLDFLRFELALDPNFRKEALNRAGKWCIENGDPERAVGFFVMNGDYDRALSVDILGRELTPPEGMTYEELTVSVIENASREAKLKYPIHLLKYAFNFLDTGRKDVFFSAVEQMRRYIADADMPDDEKKRLVGEITLLSTFGEYNDISKMASLIRRAHELTGGRPSLIRMNDTWTFGNASVLFMYHSEPGRLDAELADMKEGCGYYFALTDGHGIGGDTLMEAESLFNRGDLKKAAYIARDALDQAETREQASVCIGACFLLAREALTRGDAKAFSDARERMTWYGAQTGLRSDMQEAQMADCWLMSPFMNAFEPPTPKCFQAMPFNRVALGKLLIPHGAKNRADEWLAIADESMSIARSMRSVLAAVYCGIFTAAARLMFDDEKRAFSALDEAFSSAMSDRLYMPFAEHYFAIRPLLEKLRATNENAKKIAPLARKLEAGRRAVSRKLFMDAPFGLSKGEYRVALLASRGMPNDDIAGQLGVTRDGVRYHLKTVYKKTGAASRRELEKLVRDETLTKNR
jgi:LuxR family maltose regulon positive regulatory protein